jgi:molybdenum cofactor biosynthesis enzyme MoaA
MKNFCALPFHHVNVRNNGDFAVCCKHPVPQQQRMNINSHSVDQWRDSSYLNAVRKSFLDDQRHPECGHCWDKEDQGFVSFRQQMAKEYRILGTDVDAKNITFVDIGISNQCNLACVMCNEHYSSKILAENIKLGINVISQKDIKWTDQAFVNLEALLMENPKIVAFMGGEPLYVKRFLELVEQIPPERANSMVLHINTNATIWNLRWQQALQKFKIVRFMFSIDAVEDLYQYIRFSADWQTVQENIDSMRSLPNAKCSVNCVVQNLNVASLAPLIDWCKSRSLWLNLELLSQPEYLQFHNLPAPQKALALSSLKQIDCTELETIQAEFIVNVIEKLELSEFNVDLWKEFEKMSAMKDNVRGTDYRIFL